MGFLSNQSGFPRPAASSGGAANAVIVRKFPFTSSTPGLFTPGVGWGFYTGTIGDLVLDIMVEVDNLCGSTPAIMDIGADLSAGVFGMFHYWSAAGMSVASGSSGAVGVPTTAFTGLLAYQSTSGITARSLYGAGVQAGPVFSTNTGIGMPPMRFTAAQQLFAWVTQTGVTTGAAVVTPAPFSGTIYMRTVTPA